MLFRSVSQSRYDPSVSQSKIFTYKSTRSIREGSYKLDEIVDFDHNKQKAYVKVFNKTLKEFQAINGIVETMRTETIQLPVYSTHQEYII